MDQTINSKTIEDKKISIAIMSSFPILTIQYLILIYFNLLATDAGKMVQITSKILVGLFYLQALPSVLKRNKIKFIGVYFISIFIFILNYAIFRENWTYLQDVIFPLFFICLPSFIYAYRISDWNVLMDVMKRTSNIVFVVGTIIGILTFTGNTSIGAYSMSLSYYMLLPAIVYINEFFDKITIKNSAIFGISLLVILALGSRGAIMCLGVFAILKLIRNLKNITYKKILVYIILISIVIFSLILLNEILEFIYKFLLNNFGIRSRSIQLFLRDDIYLSGRDRLYDNVLEEIFNNPILGIGLAGDRRIINTYSHNILIEILASFGIITGIILIIGLGYLVLKSLLTKNFKKYNMIIIWLSIGFVHLFVSGSYLIDFKFWILLGLLTRNFKYK